jgi:hypothetical protein
MLFLIELTDILTSAKSAEYAARTTADIVTPMKQATSASVYRRSKELRQRFPTFDFDRFLSFPGHIFPV